MINLSHHPSSPYQVLEEMMDNGFPLSTENNVLKELVAPPSNIKKAMKAMGVGNKSKCVALGMLRFNENI